jgi:hypothetical protein
MKPQLPCPQSRGFALVVTLSLMILLTIIAVGLLTLSSISLRASIRTALPITAARKQAVSGAGWFRVPTWRLPGHGISSPPGGPGNPSSSPYHQVRDGTSYPAVLLLTGENDGRGSPANSRKMAARLQQANASTNPILVLLSSASGHGIGTALAERIKENADVLAFLFNQLGMTQPSARDFERSA